MNPCRQASNVEAFLARIGIYSLIYFYINIENERGKPISQTAFLESERLLRLLVIHARHSSLELYVFAGNKELKKVKQMMTNSFSQFSRTGSC